MINIAVTSGQEHDRNTITALLAQHDDFCITSIGVDGYDALTAAKEQQPDIIIMDFCMRDISCMDLVPLIRRCSPSTACIVLYFHDEYGAADRALQAGISGCFLRHRGFDNLPSSVRCVYHGGLYLSRPITDDSNKTERFPCLAGLVPAGHGIIGNFSLTELRIFFGITLGYTDREIAQNLNISTGSLRNCITRIKEKTNLRNRAQMAVFALSTAMIDRKTIRSQLVDCIKKR